MSWRCGHQRSGLAAPISMPIPLRQPIPARPQEPSIFEAHIGAFRLLLSWAGCYRVGTLASPDYTILRAPSGGAMSPDRCGGQRLLPVTKCRRVVSPKGTCRRGAPMAIKRIGILTGGGDVPGLNAVIKSATYRSSENDIEVVGLRRGWEALTHLYIEDANSRSHYVIPLNRENTRTIDRLRRHRAALRAAPIRPGCASCPAHLVGDDFPLSLVPKGASQPDLGRLRQGWRTSPGSASSIRSSSAVTTRSVMRPSSTNSASRSSPSRRRWTTTSVTLSSASASRPRSLPPATPSNGNAPLSVRMSESAFSEFLAAMPDLRHSISHTPPRYGVSYPSTR